MQASVVAACRVLDELDQAAIQPPSSMTALLSQFRLFLTHEILAVLTLDAILMTDTTTTASKDIPVSVFTG